VLTWCAAHDMGRVALVSRAFRLATCTSDAWHSVAVRAPLELDLRRFVRSFPTVLARARSIVIEGAESRHAIMEVRETRHDDEEEDADPRGTAPTECMAHRLSASPTGASSRLQSATATLTCTRCTCWRASLPRVSASRSRTCAGSRFG
jgi:hypothetical protein